ncbi:MULTISPECIES: thioredoxin domain-containing protein [unclassified Sphingopyxis]|jgi:protein-disulfide isomerase|uniref:thioredoxin domain-containing protein n=1 Tax=unclassified Sphingopyxis TaxID=2614943 RepID=UPI0006C613EF|nr:MULTISPECIES: thioredoxin domain-containing protein [unclassified Sphingopyxis]USI77162.1 DsbA family protein [Sphingopyxis sp. USTB-05]GAO80380.1 periplasmic thiol:disulfide interchange protein DsbA [Sphingopyxis sp. C-1]
MSAFDEPLLDRRTALLALSGAALTLIAATPAKPALWSQTVSTTPIGAFLVGNPDAKVRLVEYFSYTCHVCADFAKAGTVPLKTGYVDRGLVLFEYRNLVRDPVDMTAALLARCGGPKAFAGNHQAIFANFPAMIAKIQKATEAQKKNWFEGTTGERARKIAVGTGLSALMRARGYTQAQIDAALDSEVAQAELTGMTNIGLNADNVEGTPSFFVNGRNAGVTAWPALKSKLDLALKGS